MYCQAGCKGTACRGGGHWQWLDLGEGQKDRIMIFKHSRTAKQKGDQLFSEAPKQRTNQ